MLWPDPQLLFRSLKLHQLTPAVDWACRFSAVLAPNSKLMLSSAALFQIWLQNPVADTDSYQRNITQDRRRGGGFQRFYRLFNFFPSLIISAMSNLSRGFFQQLERVRHSLPTLIICIKLLLRDFRRGKATSAGRHSASNWKELQPSLQQSFSLFSSTDSL